MTDSFVYSQYFSECDELSEAVKNVDVELIQGEGGNLSASLHIIDFPKLLIQIGRWTGPKLLEFASTSKEYFSFLYDLNYLMPTITDGYIIDKYSFTFYPPNSGHFSRGSGVSFWAYICFKNCRSIIELVEELIHPISSTRLICYDVEAVENMHILLHRLEHLALINSQYLDISDLKRDFENEIIDAQIRLLIKSKIERKNNISITRSKKLLKNFIEYTSTNFTSDLNIPEICDELGVSLRTLYYAFDKIYKISPYQYIKLYRINKVHMQLVKSNSNYESISMIATSNGINHLGRFSNEYKKIFGISPSKVLKNSLK